jgi:nucleoside 2-deoxyribosyltransferase
MIIYNPTNGLPLSESIKSLPRHCFLMTKIGTPIPTEIKKIHTAVKKICKEYDYQVIDASYKVTGKDFLDKIWKAIAGCPLAVAIIHEDMSEETRANIFYELGVAQALGKETVVIKSMAQKVPSDFVRTEYIEFDKKFEKNFKKFFQNMIEDTLDSYAEMATALEQNPSLSIDYLKRSYLISGDQKYKRRATKIAKDAGFNKRPQTNVEVLAAKF